MPSNHLQHLIDFKDIVREDPTLKQRPLKEGTEETARKTQALMEQLATRMRAENLVTDIKMHPKNKKMWVTLQSEEARRKVDQFAREVAENEQKLLKSLPSTEEQPKKNEGDQVEVAA